METIEYEIKYPNLDVKHLISDKQLFDYDTIAAHIGEYKKGFKVKNISKTYRSGTIFTYIKIRDKEEMQEYEEFIIGLLKNYNDTYAANITKEEFIIKQQ